MPLSFLLSLVGCLFFAVYGGLIAWYHRAWTGIPVFVPCRTEGYQTRITVLVPARNEEENIGNCLQSLAAQSYPRGLFEVIVIDDHSTDDTAAIVKEFAVAGPLAGTTLARPLADSAVADAPLAVRYLPLAEEPRQGTLTAHKKFAIETGVARATGELIVTTDADC